jgi:PAS domain S-box-containing protein
MEQLESILNVLPVDVSFVDAEGKVAYFNQADKRIFPRSVSVIGRSVQNCHPPQSVHKVIAILESFRKGERDKAEFWITLNGRFVSIRYFAVRDKSRNYLGCLEVSQDLTDLRALEGERRLLQD